MRPLTDKQARILEFIRRQITRQGRPPTLREIAAKFRFASIYAAHCHLEALVKKGYIERSSCSSRGIRLSAAMLEHSGIPVVGRVAAGTPILAEQNIEGHISPQTLCPDDGSCFYLRVQGHSMKEDGILDGDFVLVRKTGDFEDGEIGVVTLDGEATVKRLRRKGRKIELIPANDEFKTRLVDPAVVQFRYEGKVINTHRYPK